jgi:orotate phosphoribosyltransferase
MTDATLARDVYRACYLTGSFVLRSGVTSSEYFDKYLCTAQPALLRRVAVQLAALVPAEAEVLAGLELGGVPLAVAVGQETGLPCAFVRKEAKAYGTAKLAEGADLAGRRVVLVEDVVTSGGQVLLSAQACRERGAWIDTVLCLVDREAGGAAALAAADLQLRALFTAAALKAAGG